MKNTKNFLLVLSLVLAFAAMFAVMAFAEGGKVNAADAANDLQWTFDAETKTLKITGTSTALTMNPEPAWDAKENFPWLSIMGQVEHVVVEAPITEICTYAFAYLPNCIDIVLPNNKITLKGYNTLAANAALTTVGPAGTPAGVIDARNFTGEVSQIGENAMRDKAITLLMPVEGKSPFTLQKFASDSTVLTIYVVAGSECETWAKDLLAKSGTAGDFTPDSIKIVNYDGTYDPAVVPEDTTAEDTTAAPEDTTAAPETPANPDGVILTGSIEAQYSKCTWTLTADGTLTILAKEGVTGWNEVPYYNQITENGWLDKADMIKKVVIGAGLQKVGASAFKDCPNLEIVEWTSIGQLANNAFDNCPKLTTIYKAGNEPVVGTFDLTSISAVNGANHFINCGVTSVNLNNKMTKLHANFFVDCAYLTNVTIGETAETIEEGAFNGCYNLKVVFGAAAGGAAENFAKANNMTFAKIGETVEIPEAVVTTAAPETTPTPETTTAALEDTTVNDDTSADGTTKAPDEAAQTSDINLVMVVAIALAALASAVVLTKKRRFN